MNLIDKLISEFKKREDIVIEKKITTLEDHLETINFLTQINNGLTKQNKELMGEVDELIRVNTILREQLLKYKPQKDIIKPKPLDKNLVFIEKAKKIHGDKYDYTLVDYHSNRDNVIIICLEHGPFSQRPDNHLEGKGCILCSQPFNTRIKNSQQNFNIPSEDLFSDNEVSLENYFGDNKGWNKFVKKAIAKYGDKFSYPINNYNNCTAPIKLICNTHGEFTTNAKVHLATMSGGCKGCLKNNLQITITEKKDNKNTEYFSDEEFELIMNELKK